MLSSLSIDSSLFSIDFSLSYFLSLDFELTATPRFLSRSLFRAHGLGIRRFLTLSQSISHSLPRLKKLQELATKLTDLWNLMDTPDEERELFDHVTCNISASVHEVTVSGALAVDLIEQAEVEVDRLDQLKSSRIKEIAFKKQSKLEDIYARAHIEIKPENLDS